MKNNIGKMGYGALRNMLMRQQPIIDRLAERYGKPEPEELLELILAEEKPEAAEVDECSICRDYADMLLQAIFLKHSVPGFDLDAELEDPRFGHLILQPPCGAGLSLEAAYHALHHAEAADAARREKYMLADHAARIAAQKLAMAVSSGGMRPAENGSGAHAAAVFAADPRRLTREERAEIRRRVNSGEKIHW